MGTMLVPIVLCFLLGSVVATPQDDFRSNLEFLNDDSEEDLNKYRLLEDVYPTHVDVELDVDLNTALFTGRVEMNVVVNEDNLQRIVFHQKVVAITGVSVTNNTGNQIVPLRAIEPFTTDSYLEIMEIHFAAPLLRGNYTVVVRYNGQINRNPIDRGFYMGYYFLNDQRRSYATTQFQPFHARKAFPCFDEPRFKSVYTITITRDTALGGTYSNMPFRTRTPIGGGRTRDVFHPTPIISAYLVAFHVSDFEETTETSTPSRPFSIISRQGVTAQHAYAAEIGVKITNALDDYFAIQYHEMGQGVLMKNDHIALPDFPSGAMENWGMVNYREAYLLYDPANTQLSSKIFIATIMAHELGHKWFGNLVTCFWWSNLWLNESFASFFEYFAAHWADPSLELDDQFVVDYVHSALNHDAGDGARPMNWTGVSSNPSVSSHFSTTSYAKGASVLKMLEHLVGTRNFRQALRYYLNRHAYDIGYPSDLYAAFETAISEDYEFKRAFPTLSITDLFDSWVQNSGSPVVTVTRNSANGALTVSQERYLVSGGNPAVAETWQIPLTWTQAGSFDFENTRPKYILTQTSASNLESSNPGDNFVIFNVAQSGLYRVNYDDDNWRRIATYLKSNNRQNIHKLNRAQIVNDVLYFVRSGLLNETFGFEIIDFLRDETDYYVWNGALTQLDWILRRLQHMPRAYDAFASYLRGLLSNVISDLGYNERASDSTSTILNRAQILNVACNLGHTGCIEDSLQKWRQFRQNTSNLVQPNLRRHVYCIGVREGDETDFNFLLERYNAAQNTADMVVMLRALACTKNQTSLERYLTESMENDNIRIHDRTNAFSFALQGNPENVAIVLSFLNNNLERIVETYGGVDRLNLCINALTLQLTSYENINTFRTWLNTNQGRLEASSITAARNVIENARANLIWGGDAAVDLFNFAHPRGASSAIFASAFLLLAAMLLQLFR